MNSDSDLYRAAARRTSLRKESKWGQADRHPQIGHVIDAQPDLPDTRDYLYQPRLTSLAPEFDPNKQGVDWWSPKRIRDQDDNPSCTGHALAALIDHMRARDLMRGKTPLSGEEFHTPWASAAMLYHTARYHDEWLGEDYGGSSCRGALQGFYFNGVCSTTVEQGLTKEEFTSAENDGEFRWFMTRNLLEDARLVQLGAYYRIRPRLPDFHAAVSEAGAILVSATIHSGWRIPYGARRISYDRFQRRPIGRHAFLIVGYDASGFLIQNSWGDRWGDLGFAHWNYEDWAENVNDAWVLRLAVVTPTNTFGSRRIQRARGPHVSRRDTQFQGRGIGVPDAPSRLNMLGHLVPLREGQIDELGRYNHDLRTLEETFGIIAKRDAITRSTPNNALPRKKTSNRKTAKRYHHVVIHFLGGHVDDENIAAYVDPLIPIYKENGVYPIFFLWETELAEAMQAHVERIIARVVKNTGHDLEDRADVRDRLIEGRLGAVGPRLVREYLRSARRTFALLTPSSDRRVYKTVRAAGLDLVDTMLEMLDARHRDNTLQFHIIGHDVGALMVSSFLEHQRFLRRKPVVSSLTLISPAITLNQLTSKILPLVNGGGDGRVPRNAEREQTIVEKLELMVLSREALQADRFCHDYGKSWPDLWSRTLGVVEERRDTKSPNIQKRKDSKGQPEPTLFKLLWLPEIAREAEAVFDEWGVNANVNELSHVQTVSYGRSMFRHNLLDLHPEIMNHMLEHSILRSPPRQRFPTSHRI